MDKTTLRDSKTSSMELSTPFPLQEFYRNFLYPGSIDEHLIQKMDLVCMPEESILSASSGNLS